MINILLPIEGLVRELDYKLLMAAKCLSKNTRIFIGQHDYLYEVSKNLRGGVYIGKNLMSRKSDGVFTTYKHQELKQRGFKIIHLDEEGGVHPGDTDNLKRILLEERLDLKAFDSDDVLCTWGMLQKTIYSEFAKDNNLKVNEKNIIVTGSPRFDILNLENRYFYNKEVKEINSSHGEFILINTNFSLFNNSNGNADSFSLRWNYDTSDHKKRKDMVDWWSYQGHTFVDFIKLITAISSEYPDKKIILRPQPSEDIDIYNLIFKDIKNISVIRSGSVIPWILASKMMIHDGCTTGVEAFFSDTKVLNFHPHDAFSNNYLPNSLSLSLYSIDEVLEKLSTFYRHEESLTPESMEIEDRAYSLLENFKESHDSFEALLNLIKIAESKIEESTFNITGFTFFRFKFLVESFLRSLIRPLFRDKQNKYIGRRNIFPGFDKEYIKYKLNLIQEVNGNKIKYKFYNENLILLETDDSE